MKMFVLCALIISSVHCNLTAQSIDWTAIDTTMPPVVNRYLLLGGSSGITHQYTPGLRCADDGACPPFTGGNGISYSGTVGYTQRLMPGLSFIGSIGIEGWSTSMSILDNSLSVRYNDEIVPLERELQLFASSISGFLSAGFQLEYDAWRLWGAPYMSYTLGSPQWRQEARIVGPSGVTYPGGTTSVEIVPTSDVPNASHLRAGFMAGARYSIPVSSTVRIEPLVTATYSPVSIQSTQSWTDLRVQAGVTIAYDMSSYPSVVDYERRDSRVDTVSIKRRGRKPVNYYKIGAEIVRRDTIARGNARVLYSFVTRTDTLVQEYRSQPVRLSVKKKVVLSDTLMNSGEAVEWTTSDDGLQVGMLNNIRFDVITQQQQNTFTTLPLLFFDQGTSALAARYRQLTPEAAAEYNYADSMSTQLDITHDVLNVIGYRLRNQQDTLVIRAYADNTTEGGSCEVASARANTIASYMREVWNISSDRLIVETGRGSCIPPIASSEGSLEGASENRRVELFTKRNDYYLPVVQQSITTAIESDLDNVEIAIGDSIDTVEVWTLTVCQGTSILATLKGQGVITTYDLTLREEQRTSLASGIPIFIDLRATMTSGDTIKTRLVVPVEVIDNKSVLTSLSLTTFDVRSASLSDRDRELLEEFLRRLPIGENISVLGYSDNRGNPESNRRLSLQRAQTVAAFIRQKRPDCGIVRVDGIGADRMPVGASSYALPEERFMSRIVQLEIVR